jgi:hypothetical protein
VVLVDLHRNLIQQRHIFTFCPDPSIPKAYILNIYTCVVFGGTFFDAIGGTFFDAIGGAYLDAN